MLGLTDEEYDTQIVEFKKKARAELGNDTSYENVCQRANKMLEDSLVPKSEPKKKTAQGKKYDFSSVVGLEEVKELFNTRLIDFVEGAEELADLGARPPKGLLIYGPPGVGKTHIMSAAINEFPDINFKIVGIDEISSKNVSEGSIKIRQMFADIKKSGKLTVLLLDEVDTILPSRAKTSSVLVSERVSEFMKILSGLDDDNSVYIVGTTNRPKNIDAAFKRSGRFEDRIRVDFPNFEERIELAEQYFSKLPIAGAEDIDVPSIVAQHTEGVTGADFQAINSKIAVVFRRNKIKTGVESLDFEEFVTAIQEGKKHRGLTIEQEKEYTVEYDEFEDEFKSH